METSTVVIIVLALIDSFLRWCDYKTKKNVNDYFKRH
jgi:hypothetical protein